jgi:hypothetical protein
MFVCTFCKKEFTIKGNMLSHQKTAKYCLEQQGKVCNNNFECQFCLKHFTTQHNLNDHNNVCKEKDKKQLKEIEVQNIQYKEKLEKQKQDYKEKLEKQKQDYEEKLEKQKQDYEEKLEKQRQEYMTKLEARLDKFESTVVNIASAPKTVKTTNVVVNNNTLNLSQEHVTKVLDEHFTKEVVAGGQKKLAEMVYEKMLKGPDGKSSYVCVDPSRQTFEFTNNDGDVERDVKAKKLTKALINSDIQKKAAEVGNQIWTKADGHVDSSLFEYCSPKVMELACFERDDSKFRSELSALTS